MVLSAWAVIYSDCTYAEGKTPTNECPGYDTKQSDGDVPVILELFLIPSYSSFQWGWSLGGCKAPLHSQRSQVHSGPES